MAFDGICLTPPPPPTPPLPAVRWTRLSTRLPARARPPRHPPTASPSRGGDGADSILATLGRADGCNVLLKLLTLTDATALRGVCREAHDAVAGYPWEDTSTFISSFARWRACFPNAARVDISGRVDVTDADFVHLRGIHTLNMHSCHQISDAAFVHLAGIHTLDMRGCEQISDAAFVHLAGIHTLKMWGRQDGITAVMRAHLRATVPFFGD